MAEPFSDEVHELFGILAHARGYPTLKGIHDWALGKLHTIQSEMQEPQRQPDPAAQGTDPGVAPEIDSDKKEDEHGS